jgi:MYXO-CTERM domain-containing protein
MDIAWSATTTSGFSTTVTSSGDTSVYTARTFTVTGSQQITFSWSGSERIAFAIVTEPNSFAPVSGLGAGWSTDLAGQSETAAAAGSVTVTLNAGNYFISNNLNGGGISGGASSFNFVVPAPGAVALLGAAGLVGTRRRRN